MLLILNYKLLCLISGAVPILTLNLQRGVTSNSVVPDSWHHQMMYGISYNSLRPNECAQIYLTNPLTATTLEALQPQLFSPSILMIKRADVLSRWTPQTDLMSLATHSNRFWHRFNVLGTYSYQNLYNFQLIKTV